MKVLRILPLLLILLIACDDREKYILALNDKPTIVFGTLQDGKILLKDSMKLGLKTGQQYYELVLRLDDLNKNIVKIVQTWTTGEGTMYQDGNLLTKSDILLPADGLVHLRIIPKTFGLNRITFTVTDKLGATNEANLELTTFKNLAPVAQYVIYSIGLNDPLEYEIDATKSYDRDAKYGGTVERYYFYVNDVEIGARMGDNPKLKWIFDQKKTYKITVKVQDGDGTYAEISRNETIR